MAAFYRLSAAKATVVIDEVRTAIGEWRSVAAGAGIVRDELDLFAPSFQVH